MLLGGQGHWAETYLAALGCDPPLAHVGPRRTSHSATRHACMRCRIPHEAACCEGDSKKGGPQNEEMRRRQQRQSIDLINITTY